MKPLPVARELTLEDVRIWRRYRRHPHYLRMREVYQRADRRDAELMLSAQDWPKKSVYLAIRHGRNVTWAEAIDLRQGTDRL